MHNRFSIEQRGLPDGCERLENIAGSHGILSVTAQGAW